MKPLFTDSEWTFASLDKAWKVIDSIAKNDLKLDYYDSQIEIISSEQMLDAYSSNAMPIMYNHWSFGKSFIQYEKDYFMGWSGLAYEVVINTNPTIAYLMDENTMTMQTLVMAHAVCGHGSFFKNNHLFADGVDAEGILDYLRFAKKYIKKCEEEYGETIVQQLLDSCHSLKLFGVDRNNRAPALSKEENLKRDEAWAKNEASIYNRIYASAQGESEGRTWNAKEAHEQFPEENLLYFIQKYSPTLKDWQREVLRIVRKIAQYFYPQMQTQLMNEGWATFIHYTIMGLLYDKGHLTEGSYLEFLRSHCAVIYQPPHARINVYALGFAMMRDLRKICESPTDEDRKWFPEIVDTDWMTTLQEIVVDYRDESFILQYLSPKVIRDLKLYVLLDKQDDATYTIEYVHSDEDVLKMRELMAQQFSLVHQLPHIEISGVEWKGDRALTLVATLDNNKLLDSTDLSATLEHIRRLWGFGVFIEARDKDGVLLDKISY